MSKIWFDVTSILYWRRPAVGVIRVETECAKYALENLNETVRFCRFEREAGYLNVDAETVRQTIHRINSVSSVSEQQQVGSRISNNVPAKVPIIVRSATIVRRLLNKLPKRIGNSIFAYLSVRREAVHSTLNGMREFRQAWRIWRNPLPNIIPPVTLTTSENRRVPFSEGDVYVSLGLDWDQKSLPFIAEQKIRTKFKALFCCYDVIPVKFPHLCVGDVSAKFGHYFADLSWCADEFVSISECSKRDLLTLLEELGAPTPMTTVIKLGSHLPQSDEEQVTLNTKDAAGDRFILFVSTIERRKNHETLYRAYTRLLDQGETNLPRLVFVGMQGWGVSDFLADLRFDYRINNLIQILTNVSDADLSWLYKNALFTVFPSLYEGWGLAIAESLSNGKFCIASNTGSISEVGGDLVEYIDPWDVPRWAERLKYYFDNPAALKEAQRRIHDQYRAPTWEATAKKVFERAEALLTK